MNDKRMCWSSDEENFRYDTLSELLDSNDELVAGSVVYVGEAVVPRLSQLCDADDVMEIMRDRADEIAGEYADGYPDVTSEAERELNDLLQSWMAKHCQPHFYTVKDIKPYVLTEEDVPKIEDETV